MRQLEELIRFLSEKMKMTEIYQPAIILSLLEHDGAATKTELAQVLSGYDESIQEYYKGIVMQWPKITLEKHNVVTYQRTNQTFKLNFELNDPQLIEAAKDICEEKIEEWITQRQLGKGKTKKVASKRYRVLKAARGKCELCGISSKVSPIDIDHIIPQRKADKNGKVLKDGELIDVDDERNLQALCYRCNRAKRDTDQTDFRLPDSKLVRDYIPEIIAEDGRIAVTKTLSGITLQSQLYEKLVEEHAELIAGKNLEEIADMIEVLFSLASTYGHNEAEVLELVYKKRAERGGFSKGIFLQSVESKA